MCRLNVHIAPCYGQYDCEVQEVLGVSVCTSIQQSYRVFDAPIMEAYGC